MKSLEAAWRWREERDLFKSGNPIRVFHGPVEGSPALRSLMIEKFGHHFWAIEREGAEKVSEANRQEIARFLMSKGGQSGVFLSRPEKGVPPESAETWFGSPPAEGSVVLEKGLSFQIRFLKTRHPGLFLDHAPLRAWLLRNSQGLRVLNTFAYTGSLSVAAAKGGAREVVTVDLSRPAISWAKENWTLNSLPPEMSKFLVEDTFDYFPRLQKRGEKFDCVILDPPSFARGNKGVFSTAKDLKKLHLLALSVVSPGGLVVTSINSANVTEKHHLDEVNAAASELGLRLEVLYRIEQPETFPWREDSPSERYLKGAVFRCPAS